MDYVKSEKIERQRILYRCLMNAQRFRPRRQLYGVRISTDHGLTWRLRAFCQSCITSQTEPTRLIRLGVSGCKSCEGCDALNI